MASVGSELIIKTLEVISSGNVSVQIQDNALATSAPKITKEMCKINWNNSADKIHNLVRGLSPTPSAYTLLSGKMLKIFKTKITDESSALPPGSIHLKEGNLFVHTADKQIVIENLQLEGKKRMDTSEFLRGFRIESESNLKFD